VRQVTPAAELNPASPVPGKIAAACFDVDATLADYETSTRMGLCELLGTDDAWAAWCTLTNQHHAGYPAGRIGFEPVSQRRAREVSLVEGSSCLIPGVLVSYQE
jgi:putative hydrolase of the HAD superfamily